MRVCARARKKRAELTRNATPTGGSGDAHPEDHVVRALCEGFHPEGGDRQQQAPHDGHVVGIWLRDRRQGVWAESHPQPSREHLSRNSLRSAVLCGLSLRLKSMRAARGLGGRGRSQLRVSVCVQAMMKPQVRRTPGLVVWSSINMLFYLGPTACAHAPHHTPTRPTTR